MQRNNQTITFCLLCIILSLLVVGIVSNTLMRHIIQITPVILVFIITIRKIKWSSFAVLPLFIFWLVIMCFIWLYLLGIANIVTGRFSPIEIIMTLLIGICSLLGIIISFKNKTSEHFFEKILVFLFFLLLQIGVMWMSLLQS